MSGLERSSSASSCGGGAGEFATTHWSVVARAAQLSGPSAQAALEQLCRAYWRPLYAYLRRQGQGPEEAEDLTQEFFARLLEKRYLEHADAARGRFRNFLLTSLKRFLVTEWRRTARQKRGGGQPVLSLDAASAAAGDDAELADSLTPEKAFEKRWALTLMERVLSALASEYAAADKTPLFEALKDSLWGEQPARPYSELAQRLGVSEGAVKVSAHRLRLRCRGLLRAEVGQTVACPQEIDAELRHLVAVLSG
jgi:RNA polymerase sigma factor (sigma-70 family)